jgi:hypothetical protein
LFDHKIITKSKSHNAHEVDLFNGKAFIDGEEELYLAKETAREEARGFSRWRWFYSKILSWLF